MGIRLAHDGDAAALADIYRPAVVDAVISFETDPPDAAEMAARVARVQARTPWLVLEHAGRVLGYAYASPHRDRAAYRWSVDVSAYVHADARRCGAARALYSSLLAALPLQGFRRAYAGITLPNPASVGLHAAMGFVPVGVYHRVGYKHGAWHDVAWLERDLGPDDAPGEPRLLPDCRDDPELVAALASGEAHFRAPDR